MPSSGNAKTGSSAVASIGTASVTHQRAIQTSMPMVARAAGDTVSSLPSGVVKLSGSITATASAISGAATSATRRQRAPSCGSPVCSVALMRLS